MRASAFSCEHVKLFELLKNPQQGILLVLVRKPPFGKIVTPTLLDLRKAARIRQYVDIIDH